MLRTVVRTGVILPGRLDLLGSSHGSWSDSPGLSVAIRARRLVVLGFWPTLIRWPKFRGALLLAKIYTVYASARAARAAPETIVAIYVRRRGASTADTKRLNSARHAGAAVRFSVTNAHPIGPREVDGVEGIGITRCSVSCIAQTDKRSPIAESSRLHEGIGRAGQHVE